MAVPAVSSPGVSSENALKISSVTPEPVLKTSEPVGDDAPAPTLTTANGVAAQQPGAQKHTDAELVNGSVAQNSADQAAGSAAGTGKGPVSSSPDPVVPNASPQPSQSAPRVPDDHKDKDGDKPGPSSSPTKSSSPTPSRSQSAKKPTLPASKANGTSTHKPSSRSSKPSFLSKVLRALVPCINPSSDTHPIEVHAIASLSGSKEKPPSTSSERVTAPPAASNASVKEVVPPAPAVTEPATTVTLVEPDNLSLEKPAIIEEELVIPPTPPAPHLLPLEETEGVTEGAVQAPGSTGGSPSTDSKRHSRDSIPRSNVSAEEESEGTSFTEDDEIDGLSEEDDEERLIMNGGAGIPIGPDGIPKPLLPPISPKHAGRKCLILDLDETLVHSSFKSIQQADYVVPVEIEYHLHNVYVIKRPGVDKFLKMMGEIYEVVVFTASLSKYADPVLDKLDIHHVVSHRLFRESCYNHRGNYVKDLSQLGRPIADTIILDNSPASYIFHPNNAVPVSSWFNDPHDTELTDLIPFLTDLATVDDVRGVLDGAR